MEDGESLTHTPTWAVAGVCVIFVILSLLVERGIHKLGKVLLQNKQKPLYEALQKMKEELMLLGFISLLLTVAGNPISKLCVPESWSEHMLPCTLQDNPTLGVVGRPTVLSPGASQVTTRSRRLLLVASDLLPARVPEIQAGFENRVLDEGSPRADQCKEGYAPLFSLEGLHQLHIFIFVMAVVHVGYSCLTMLLGFTQLRSWRKWEEETRAKNYVSVDGNRRSFRLERQSTFVTSRTRNRWCTPLLGSWIASFFRQFGRAVTRSDYMSLRMGFIKNHNASKRFNFHQYMMRTLEDDFKTVVGISGYLWIFVIIFMILNVHGWYAFFWISFIPIVVSMVIGTKLQHIITQLALETAQSHIAIKVPINPRDELFWFNRPDLILYLIHFVLFQNAFELAFCLWLLFTFGFHSCLIDKHGFSAIRVVVGLLAQVLCSYSTLPLYALVTQMGSHYKKAIFDEPVKNAIYGWRSKARESRRIRQKKSFDRQLIQSTRGQSKTSRFELLNEVHLFSADSSVDQPNSLERVPSNACQQEDDESRSAHSMDLEKQGRKQIVEDTQPSGKLLHSSSAEPAALKNVEQLAPTFTLLDRSRSDMEFPAAVPAMLHMRPREDHDNNEGQRGRQKGLLGRTTSLMAMPQKAAMNAVQNGLEVYSDEVGFRQL